LGTIDVAKDDQTVNGGGGETSKQAIMIINKTHFTNQQELLETINSPEQIQKITTIGANDVYLWSLGWLNPARLSLDQTPDLKISMIFPATQVV
jgi:hypothetical protein